jgi:type IV secretory pathway VirB6-like protein
MKTALIRILTIATLATSISAFAADDAKHNDPATASATSQQQGCAAGHDLAPGHDGPCRRFLLLAIMSLPACRFF